MESSGITSDAIGADVKVPIRHTRLICTWSIASKVPMYYKQTGTNTALAIIISPTRHTQGTRRIGYQSMSPWPSFPRLVSRPRASSAALSQPRQGTHARHIRPVQDIVGLNHISQRTCTGRRVSWNPIGQSKPRQMVFESTAIL